MRYARCDFIVIDTEGRDTLNEIAVLDAQGNLLFEGFVQGHEAGHDVYPLAELLSRLTAFAEKKNIVCHYAEHEEQILRKSFAAAQLPWPGFHFICTWESAKRCFPDLSSYSLEYLSKSLRLRVKKRYFNIQAAHSARYDALFTHQLYRKMHSTRCTVRAVRTAREYSPIPLAIPGSTARFSSILTWMMSTVMPLVA